MSNLQIPLCKSHFYFLSVSCPWSIPPYEILCKPSKKYPIKPSQNPCCKCFETPFCLPFCDHPCTPFSISHCCEHHCKLSIKSPTEAGSELSSKNTPQKIDSTTPNKTPAKLSSNHPNKPFAKAKTREPTKKANKQHLKKAPKKHIKPPTKQPAEQLKNLPSTPSSKASTKIDKTSVGHNTKSLASAKLVTKDFTNCNKPSSKQELHKNSMSVCNCCSIPLLPICNSPCSFFCMNNYTPTCKISREKI